MKKKIYKFVSVAVIAVAMVVSFQMSRANSKSNLDLESIIATCIASSETTAWNCNYTGNWTDQCDYFGTTVINCIRDNTTTNCQYN